MKVVIFAGGVGSRLWPLSRKNSPKQFEKILGEKSTLQLAADRLQPDFSWDDLYVATGKQYTEIVKEQLHNIPEDHIVGEPQRRDVGPAVGLMTALLARDFPDEPMAILWSDHLVKKEEHFRKILLTAGEVVKESPNKIIFVSQEPRFASENLGWIDFGDKVFDKEGIQFNAFTSFKYRPDIETAKAYFASGHHAWNLGYFVTTPRFLLEQYKLFAPEVYKGLEEIANAYRTDLFDEVLGRVYPTLEKISFDNAILEKLNPQDAYVISENIEWSDIGAWEALKEALAKEVHENVVKGNVIAEDTADSLLFNFTNQMVVGLDLENMIIVNTGDVLLVCPKTSVSKIKKFVESLEGTQHEHLA